MDSQQVVKALHDVDPGFQALCDTMFGKAVDAADVWEFLYAPDGVSKMSPGAPDLHIPGASPTKGVLVPKRTLSAQPAQRPLKVQTKAVTPQATGVWSGGKADDSIPIVWAGEFSKLNTPRRQAFGWASIVEIDGQPVVDRQGDLITPEDIEKAAYAYVLKSRVGGTQHERDHLDRPVQAGTLIESIVYTDEKYEALAKSMNVDPAVFDKAPRGWWTGYQYEPGKHWDDIEKGHKTGFSIHGRGKRVAVEV